MVVFVNAKSAVGTSWCFSEGNNDELRMVVDLLDLNTDG